MVNVTTVVRVAALIRSNLSNCMFGGGIYDLCSICGVVVVVVAVLIVVVVVFPFPITTIITNTTNITTTIAITVSFLSTFTTLHTHKVKYGTLVMFVIKTLVWFLWWWW